MKFQTVGIVADKLEEAVEARKALASLCNKYDLIISDENEITKIDVIIALGGDGFMLHTIHRYMDRRIPIYGMNRGTVGFLMNKYSDENLLERLEVSGDTIIHPLKMKAISEDGKVHKALAINEISLLRKSGQAAKIKISVDGVVHMEEMVCDGVLVSTPAGSSAYNVSAGGTIIPLKSDLLTLTPISAFRPRRWRGAILPHKVTVRFDIIHHEKRPVDAVADFNEVENVVSVEIEEDRTKNIHLLFDPSHSLEERIIREQFTP